MTLPKAEPDELMRAANRGDADAYRKLVHLLAPVLRGYARSALKRHGASTEHVEDIVQETLLAMHLKRHTWLENRPLLPWVRAIAHNKLLDHLRQSGRRQHLPVDDFEDVLIADESPSAASGLDAEIAIGKLKGRQRDIVIAIALDGWSPRDVAQRLGMTEGAVRVVFHRALRALSKALRDD